MRGMLVHLVMKGQKCQTSKHETLKSTSLDKSDGREEWKLGDLILDLDCRFDGPRFLQAIGKA
jgi:hypothetical protein